VGLQAPGQPIPIGRFRATVDGSSRLLMPTPLGVIKRYDATGAASTLATFGSSDRVQDLAWNGSTVLAVVAGGSGAGVAPISDSGTVGARASVPGAYRLRTAPGGPTYALSASGATKLTAAGLVDTTWASGGTAPFTPPTGLDVLAPSKQAEPVVDAAGGIVVPWNHEGGTDPTTWLTRITPAGTPDSAYGTGGIAKLTGTVATTGAEDQFSLRATDRLGRFGTGVAVGIARGGLVDGDDAVAGLDAAGHTLTTFGSGTAVAADVPNAQAALDAGSVVTLPNGRMVVAFAASDQSVRLMELGPTGIRYEQFGTNGTGQPLPTGTVPVRPQVFAAPGDKLLVLTDGERTSITRYLGNGAIDTTYGAGGTVVLDSTTGTQVARGAVEPDGSLVVVGAGAEQGRPVAQRISPAGVPGARSDVLTKDGAVGRVDAVARDAAGRFLVVTTAGATGATAGQTTIIRLKATLAGDGSFAAGSTRVLSTHALDVRQVAIAPGNRPVVVGTDTTAARAVAIRVTVGGGLDPTFGPGGAATLPVPAGSPAGSKVQPKDATVDLQGGVVVVGRLSTTADTAGVGATRALVQRLTPAGQPDPGFDQDGSRTWPTSQVAVWSTISRDAGGKLVIAGSRTTYDAVVTRLVGLPAS